MYRGWCQVAFDREITDRLSPARIGDLALLLLRTGDEIRAFEAACPHRGAHLAYGGVLEGDAIVCPFHGHRIGLGEDSPCAFRVRELRSLHVNGLVFVLPNPRFENGFGAALEDLEATHYFVQGFKLDIAAPPELVIENGFDRSHFKSVHGLASMPQLRLLPTRNGEMKIEGKFESPSTVEWVGDDARAGTETVFRCTVYSPNVCVTEIESGEHTAYVISGATPTDPGHCTVWVSLAVPPSSGGGPPDEQLVRRLLRDSNLSYEQDMAVWENIVPGAPHHLAPEDDLVMEYHRYCAGFADA